MTKEIIAECGCPMRESDPGIMICGHGSSWIGLGCSTQLRSPDASAEIYSIPNTLTVKSVSDVAMSRAKSDLADMLRSAATAFPMGFIVTFNPTKGTE